MTKIARTWPVYRTRFLIRARQLNRALTFIDSLGREHRGRKGDYLVESCDGSRCITPRKIFEDVYVTLESSQPTMAFRNARSHPMKTATRSPLPKFNRASKKGPASCGKAVVPPRIPAVNCLRYNM